MQSKIIDITLKNIKTYQPRCFMKEGEKSVSIKGEWLKKRFKEGMKIKQLYLENEKKVNGFIEYVPGDNAWRAVEAKGYMFIHCLWIYPNKFKQQGYGSKLLREVQRGAKNLGMVGVAAITSEGSFMAGKALFEKNGFKSGGNAKPGFNLMIKNLGKETHVDLPRFKETQKVLESYKGLNVVYTKQCPWVIRSIEEIKEMVKKLKIKIKFKELMTAKDVQNGPSIYGSFSLILDGKLLADHFISKRRFLNILKKEQLI